MIEESKWLIHKGKGMAKCACCKFTLKDKEEIELIGTFMQGYRYCPYCGKKMTESEVVG